MLSTLIKGKVRLWVEYFLVAAIVALLAVAVIGYIERLQLRANVADLKTEVTSAQGRVAQVEEVNRQQQEALGRIEDLRALDGEVLTGLAGDLSSLRVRDRGVAARIAHLEKTNEAVRAFLDGRLPVGGCVLDNSCAPGGGDEGRDGEAAPGADAAVPEAGGGSSGPRARPRREQ